LYHCKKSIEMFSEKVTSLKTLLPTAEKLVKQFPDQRVFAFYGNMGAGKTTFIQSVCKILGTNDNVTSPTFALINEYKTEAKKSIFHFDFYRIKNMEEAFDLGYEDYIYSGNYCLIEWPEMIEPLLPNQFVKVQIDVDETGNRLVSAKIVKS